VTGPIKNILISHIHEDDEGLTPLKDLLKEGGMKARDYSIRSDNPNNAKFPDYIKTEILRPRIEWAGCLVVYISPETKDSDFVEWEIEEAARQGKRIVGVWERGAGGCEMPEALDQYGDACVGWISGKIVDAISGNRNDFEGPDGTPSPERAIKRHPCG